MKRIVIIVEGDTEKEFIDKVLSPYFHTKGIYAVDCFKIKHTKGGLTKYQHLKTDIINCIFESNVIVTTLIDYYALPKDFPEFEDSKKIVNKSERISFLEEAITHDIQNYKKIEFNNLIPYIQLHEFEALVFASLNGILNLYTDSQAKFTEINDILKQYTNPEDINEGSDSAPSKRLRNLIPGYNKIVDGIMIIEENGIENILKKCPRFNSWVNFLIAKALE